MIYQIKVYSPQLRKEGVSQNVAKNKQKVKLKLECLSSM